MTRGNHFQEAPAKRIDWETPQWLFDELDAEFHFTLDVCADISNYKVDSYYAFYQKSSLERDWTGMCWMNPPYGRDISKWVQKAYHSACAGDATVVCLLPVRSDNSWWQYIVQSELRFLRGRVTFVGAESGAMFPVCLAIFHAHLDPGGIMKVWNPRNRGQEKLKLESGELRAERE